MSRNDPTLPSPYFPGFCYSVGIEFKFIVKARTHFWDGTDSKAKGCSPHYLCQQLIDILRAHGVGLSDYNTYYEDRRMRWSLKYEDDIWTQEGNVLDGQSDPWVFTRVALESPVLPADPELFSEICRTVIRLKRFKCADFDLQVDSTCGLRVNVGIMRTDDRLHRQSIGFSLFAVRNLIQFVVKWGRVLSAVHPFTRVFRARNCLVPAVYLLPGDVKLLSCNLKFWPVAHIYEFWELHRPRKAGFAGPPVYSIRHLDRDTPYCETATLPVNTIEFRQHKATLEYEELFHWISLTVKIVHFCYAQAGNTLPSVLRWYPLRVFWDLEIHPSSVEEMLNMVGAPAQATYYLPRLHNHRWALRRTASSGRPHNTPGS